MLNQPLQELNYQDFLKLKDTPARFEYPHCLSLRSSSPAPTYEEAYI